VLGFGFHALKVLLIQHTLAYMLQTFGIVENWKEKTPLQSCTACRPTPCLDSQSVKIATEGLLERHLMFSLDINIVF